MDSEDISDNGSLTNLYFLLFMPTSPRKPKTGILSFLNSNFGIFILSIGISVIIWVSTMGVDYYKLKSDKQQRIDSLKTEISIRLKYLIKIDKEHFRDEHALMDSAFYGIDKAGYNAKLLSVYPEKYSKRSLISLSSELYSLSKKNIDRNLQDALTEMPKILRGEIFSGVRNSTVVIFPFGGKILHNNQPVSKEDSVFLKNRIVIPIEKWISE